MNEREREREIDSLNPNIGPVWIEVKQIESIFKSISNHSSSVRNCGLTRDPSNTQLLRHRYGSYTWRSRLIPFPRVENFESSFFPPNLEWRWPPVAYVVSHHSLPATAGEWAYICGNLIQPRRPKGTIDLPPLLGSYASPVSLTFFLKLLQFLDFFSFVYILSFLSVCRSLFHLLENQMG